MLSVAHNFCSLRSATAAFESFTEILHQGSAAAADLGQRGARPTRTPRAANGRVRRVKMSGDLICPGQWAGRSCRPILASSVLVRAVVAAQRLAVSGARDPHPRTQSPSDHPVVEPQLGGSCGEKTCQRITVADRDKSWSPVVACAAVPRAFIRMEGALSRAPGPAGHCC